ncbi:phage tail protein [Erythrobacter sp. WG]|uniref:phage tail protein n=1 Tax=Erythrobacter sp. WG TaxID=2985510 RepID=UPI00226F22B0|nr:phage tail protein [Erythrobacter sp. WG]MCX9146627.1 phage tail protein [Erythrobacter sp. WG]
MSKVLRPILQIAAIAVNFIPGLGQLASFAITAALTIGAALLPVGGSAGRRSAAAAGLQLGEQPRQAIFGRSATAGSLVDAFNYGGKYGTDWEVLVIALADHRCDALEGFFVDDTYVAYTGDGDVPGFNSQLRVFWRNGAWGQEVPWILTDHGPGWTADDRGWGIAYAVVAYKADDEKAKNPIWTSGRPRFRFVVRGLRCYDPRKDSTVGGSGPHRWTNAETWEWSENPIVIRYNWVRGIYAGDQVNDPGMLIIGRGLSAIEAPPQNVFARANLCDELVDGQKRYTIGGLVAASEPYIDVESDFAAAVGGVISQPEGAVEIDPGQARAPVAHFTDADIIVGSKVTWNRAILGQQDNGWVNTVVARFTDPAQRWNVRSAPVRRETADVIADRGPREQQPTLDFVTNQPQAQRIAEIIRRLGRLWGRATVTLPPRFASIEEGDWVTWQSDRRFGGATRTFRVEAWGSDRAWHHQLSLRQISASVFSDTDPLDDGVIASNQAPPPVVATPGIAAWTLDATQIAAGGVRVPALLVTGQSDDPAAESIVVEYVQQSDEPGVNAQWSFAANARPDLERIEIPVPGGGSYWVAISYVVQGVLGDRRVLGPAALPDFAYPDGVSFADLRPAEAGSTRTQTANANRVPFSRMEGNRGWALLFNPAGLTAPVDYGEFQGLRFFRATATATAPGQQVSIGNGPLPTPAFKLNPGERLSVQARVENAGPAAGPWTLAIWGFQADGVTQTQIGTISGEPRSIGAGVVSFFVDVPSWAVAGRLEFYGFSSGAGTMQVAFSEPMVTSALPGQTLHPPFTPGPNAFDAADVTAQNTAAAIANQSPWATWPGLTPAVLEASLAQARADAEASLADLTAIASDGVVTRGEKISVRERRTNIQSEFPIWRDRAIDFGVDVGIRTNYQAAYDALMTYLAAINIDANSNSTVVRADFVAGFNNYAVWRTRVIEAISQIAAQRAQWAGVTGAGRPEDNADVTAGKVAAGIANQSPWATWPGLTPTILEQNLANAQADAAQSKIDLENIANDGRLTRGEKISVRERRSNIQAEFPIWRDRAIDFGVDAGIRTNYQAAYDALIGYLSAVGLDANNTSNIVRADFVAGFVNYATWRERVIEAISQIASQRAVWAGVTGAGKPENNADVTAGKVAAGIVNQGTLATRNNVAWAAEISGRPPVVTDLTNYLGVDRISPWYVIGPDSNSLLGGRWPEEANSNRTETRVASAVAGQGPWATTNVPVSKLAMVRPNMFPYPFAPSDGRSPAQIGWANAVGGGGSLAAFRSQYLDGDAYVFARSNGGAADTVFPLYDIPFVENMLTSVGLTGYGGPGTTFSPYVECLNQARNTALSWHPLSYNGTNDRWEANGFTTPPGTAWLRLVCRATFSASGAYQDAVWWAIKVERGAQATPFSETAFGRTFGNQVEYNNGQVMNDLRPGEFGANVTENRVASAIANQGALATKSNVAWSSEIWGRPAVVTDLTTVAGVERINPWYVASPDSTSLLGNRWPDEGGANRTQNHAAAAIVNQGDLATRNAATLPFSQGNLVVNSDFMNGLLGWDAAWDGTQGGTVNRGLNLPGWHGQMNVAYAERPGTAPIGSVFDAFVIGTDLKRFAIPVLPGERVFFSCLLGAHRCSAYAQIGFYDGSGNYIVEASGNTIAENLGANNGNPATMTRSAGFATAPANARYVRLWARGIISWDWAYIFFAQPFVTKVPASQTEWLPYSSGPSDRAADRTVDQPVVSLLNPSTGRAASRRLNSQIMASGILQTLDTNPLTATTDFTNTSTITINAHTVFDDQGTTSFSAASIGGLTGSTIYYVYEFNPDFVGGARSYVATTNRNDLTGFGRRFVGWVRTPDVSAPPATGGGVGGGGWGTGGWGTGGGGGDVPPNVLP